jgi:hypothetical protein
MSLLELALTATGLLLLRDHGVYGVAIAVSGAAVAMFVAWWVVAHRLLRPVSEVPP